MGTSQRLDLDQPQEWFEVVYNPPEIIRHDICAYSPKYVWLADGEVQRQRESEDVVFCDDFAVARVKLVEYYKQRVDDMRREYHLARDRLVSVENLTKRQVVG